MCAYEESESDPRTSSSTSFSDPATYLVGNSLGLQPRRTWDRVRTYLDTWAVRGVTGHFSSLSTTPTTTSSSSSSNPSSTTTTPPQPPPPWIDVDARAAEMMAPLVGAADSSEVAVMQTLSANLHLLLCAFYKPDIKGRHEILLEAKAFPSDRFIVESQIQHHGLSPSTSLVALGPTETSSPHLLSTPSIISALDAHASTAAVLLLPGVQYYTGQLLDIPLITSHARSLGIAVIWDLAHAVGNVVLRLHDWGVDGAAWCGYKYLNGGPGCIAGLFLHQNHHHDAQGAVQERGLRGWWGTAKKGRFDMDTSRWTPGAGAAAMQLSNPSVLCTTALCASLEVFDQAGGIGSLREKSIKLTTFLYDALDALRVRGGDESLFEIITPADPLQRGAQLSVLLLRPGMLDAVVEALLERGVYVDERRPDVIRVAPAPLYNTFEDCCDFVEAFEEALVKCVGPAPVST
jgi:kynureninase